MPDYPTDAPGASTPDLEASTSANVEQLLAMLNAIPRDELPNGPARERLKELVRSGQVDNFYTPLGDTRHNMTWTTRPAEMDPRQRVSEWAALFEEQALRGAAVHE